MESRSVVSISWPLADRPNVNKMKMTIPAFILRLHVVVISRNSRMVAEETIKFTFLNELLDEPLIIDSPAEYLTPLHVHLSNLLQLQSFRPPGSPNIGVGFSHILRFEFAQREGVLILRISHELLHDLFIRQPNPYLQWSVLLPGA